MEFLRKVIYRFNDRTRKKNIFLFFGVLFFIIIVSGTLMIDQKIADNGTGYFTHRNIQQTNEAIKLGYIKYETNDYADTFGLEWEWKPGVKRIIRSGPDDYDDIGYIVIQQTLGLLGVPINIHSVEIIHNLAFIISLVVLSFVVARLCKSHYAGWIFMILALMLKSRILSLVYGTPDSRTIVIIFPILAFSIIFLLCRKNALIGSVKGQLLVLFCGLTCSIMYLIRSNEGMVFILTLLFCIMVLKIKLKYKLISVCTVVLSFITIFILLPGAIALHRDMKTGEYNGGVLPYLRGPGKHQSYHSLVIGLGRYPNSIGMIFDDIGCYEILRERFPDAMHPSLNYHGKGYYDGLRSIFLDYVTHYPKEYITNLSKAYFELFYFIPYATSTGNLPRDYGYLPEPPGVIVDKRDLGHNVRGIVTLKSKYLKLSHVEWATFCFAIITIMYFVFLYLSNRVENVNKKFFLSICFAIFLQGTVRAMVPVHGWSLVISFWIFFFITLLYILFNRAIPTRKEGLINLAKKYLSNNV
ncbi:MAG: hypothetical protein D8M57_00160 [Candidatus Scalindua sp. AMX11]|nr:MAG: hypothetical protein DWQ00_18825 [Candidatus Scalindua sp.]NOG84120.1 hypothetical protein [Planctomycetota bacterium]RZV98970.1 MAG: hypothetical protein EX341_00745 [Candidatus Scalindua sp. SCAELEC01]TDE66838.1 MAG: hypothetical protein D8M57_00160 [Candidatus Scalindua sp. AMX11]GJQ57637.1 MAG: hypothetical protein SCALA701_04380 [Candidatus Scalindua sp.]